MEILNFELTTIQENAFIYETHLKNVKRRRDMWAVAVKDKIKSTLESVQSNFKRIDWEISAMDERKNLETVMMKIKDTPSGISEAASDGKTRQFIKIGAELGFTQMISGKINVWFEYPYWEDLQISKQLRKHLVTIEPSYVTEGLIAGFVHQFLADVTLYESGV
ncbi:MAG TPA: hypothetical protein ENI20_00105 [Bacteroides sp.]|nr:hypothetical protein [Bacteroides sp.]